MLYVVAGVTETLEHADWFEVPRAHFGESTVLAEIFDLGETASALRERRRTTDDRRIPYDVVARLLRIGEKTARRRLCADNVLQEIAAARAQYRMDWVSPHQLRAAAEYFGEKSITAALS